MLLKPFFWLVLKLIGWKAEGKIPKDLKKYVMIVVPHTSNFDFLIGICIRPFINAGDCGFLIKNSYMKPPFGIIFKWLGGVGVERDRAIKAHSLVDQVADAYHQNDRMAICVTPEGSRSLRNEWKTGFYRIAQKAQVPIAFGYIDYHRKASGIGRIFYPTGNYEQDLEEMQAYFRTITPHHRDKSNLDHIPQPRESRIWHYIKLAFRWILLAVAIFLLWNYKSVWYGINQGIGQAQVIWKAQPIADFLEDEAYPDSLKEQIKLIQEIREYAFDSIGLDRIDAYTKMYDQQGQPLLWAVTACERFDLKPHRWCFPIAGCFPYKGYFDLQKAKNEQASFDSIRYDAGIRQVSAWSTLGWLNDPILSDMLTRPPGRLANLIIHELTHGTLFVKDGIEYNENLASFVGNEGAIRFLKAKYGVNSKELTDYQSYKTDRKLYVDYVLKSAKELDLLYDEIIDMTEKEKHNMKEKFISTFKEKIKKIDFYDKRYITFMDNIKIDNTFFMSYIRYEEKQNDFQKEFSEKFNSDFPAYISHLKATYPSLF